MKRLLPSPPGLLLAALLLGGRVAGAQSDPIRFGKPEAAELGAAPFVADSAAAAVVLCDYGRSRLEGYKAGFRVVFERVTRIKILKKAGYAAATVAVPLYHEGNNTEKLSNLRGLTHNLVNGQLQSTKMDPGASFSEDYTDRLRLQKFTLPDVRVGSVIEYAYTLSSDYLFNFQDWDFQGPYPVRWSEYRTSIPVFYKYKIIYQGSRQPDVSQVTAGSASLAVDNKIPFGAGLAAGQTNGSLLISAPTENHQWVMKNVAPFREEPYLTTARDYLARLDFELTGEQWPDQPYRDLTGTWAKMNQLLLQDEQFGQVLKASTPLKAQAQALVARYPTLTERATAVRELVLGAVRYDGRNRYEAESLRRACETHRGSSAEVNLLLIAALREAGVPAEPVLLSTRDHGRVSREYPLLEKFNYVLALVSIPGSQDLLLDATDPLLPGGTLPERCLNQQGRLISAQEGESRWIDLAPGQRHLTFQRTELSVAADGSLRGKVHEEYSGYAGAAERRHLGNQGEKAYLAGLSQRHADWTLSSLSVGQAARLDQPLQLDYSFAQPAATAAGGPQLYLSPLAALGLEENPFPQAERQYPVDFGTVRDHTRLLTLSLPAGYELAEVPRPSIVDLPNGGGRFLYNVTVAGDVVQLTSRLSLRKPVYEAAEYAALRELYRLMLEKQAEKLVIRKKA